MYLKNLFLTSVLLIMLYFNHLFLFIFKTGQQNPCHSSWRLAVSGYYHSKGYFSSNDYK